MSTAQETFAEHILRVPKNEVVRYASFRNEARMLMASESRPGVDGSMEDFYQREWIRDRFRKAAEVASPETRTAVADSMAWAHRAWIYSEIGYKEGAGVLVHRTPSCMRDEVVAAVDLVAQIQTVTSGRAVDVSLSRLSQWQDDLRQKPGEVVAVLGLNGVGKSSVIKSLISFSRKIGIVPNLVKFPREISPVSMLVSEIAAGNVEIDPSARQLIYAADMLDYWARSDQSSPVTITDRLPSFDGMVYTDSDTAKLLSLASIEAARMPIVPIAVDRHPRVCLEAVEQRVASPRIYERRVEQMAIQTANMVALSDLPGFRVVNADGTEPVDSRFYAAMNVVDAAVSSGIFARALVHMGEFDNFAHAQNYVKDQSWEWFFQQRKSRSASI